MVVNFKIVLALLFMIAVLMTAPSCSYAKEYTTRHGLQVYCTEGVCFPKEHIEISLDHTIDKFVENGIVDKNKIYDILVEEYEMHELHIKKVRYGKKGSCKTDENPDRRCAGIVCSPSPNGWCWGLHKRMHVDKHISFSLIEIAKFANCPAGNALVHEFVHMLSWRTTGNVDSYHENEKLFYEGCKKKYEDDKEKLNECALKTVTHKANVAISEELNDICDAL